MSSIRTVLCPIDFTPLSNRALTLAVEVCERFGARLVLHHDLGAAPPAYLGVNWQWSEEHAATDERKAELALAKLRELLAALPSALEHEAKVSRDPVDDVVLHLAETLPAQLVVMGSHGKSDADHRSLTEQIIVRSPCPVLTLCEEAHAGPLFAEPIEVVVPVDFSDLSERAIDQAVALHENVPLRAHLLHVLAEDEREDRVQAANDRIDALRQRLPEPVRAGAEVLSGKGPIAGAIEAFAAKSDARFVLMAAHRKGLLRRLLSGSTTADTLHGSPLPVWYVSERAMVA